MSRYEHSQGYNDSANARPLFSELLTAHQAPYEKYRHALLEHHTSTEASDDHQFLYGMTNDPYTDSFREIVALRDMGYDVAMTKDQSAAPGGFSLEDDFLFATVNKNDERAVKAALARSNESFDMFQKAHDHGLLTLEDTNIDEYLRLLAEQTPRTATIYQASPHDRRQLMLFRSFMTTLNVNKYATYWLTDHRVPEIESAYVTMYEHGIRPFNIEELYGLSVATMYTIVQSRDIAPPATA